MITSAGLGAKIEMYCKSFTVFVKRMLLISLIGFFAISPLSVPASLSFLIHERGIASGIPKSHDAASGIGTLEIPGAPLSQNPTEEEFPAALRSSCETAGNPVQLNGRTRNKTVSRNSEAASPYGVPDGLSLTLQGVRLYISDNVYAKAFSNAITTRKLE